MLQKWMEYHEEKCVCVCRDKTAGLAVIYQYTIIMYTYLYIYICRMVYCLFVSLYFANCIIPSRTTAAQQLILFMLNYPCM